MAQDTIRIEEFYKRGQNIEMKEREGRGIYVHAQCFKEEYNENEILREQGWSRDTVKARSFSETKEHSAAI